MGMRENIAAVRGNAGSHGQNFFIYYFTKFPQHQNNFNDYKGKDVKSLKSVGKFASHTTKVITMLLDILERSGDAGALSADAQKLCSMPQHANLSLVEFKDMFAALVPYLEDTLGGACDKAGFEKAGKSILAALQAAGM